MSVENPAAFPCTGEGFNSPHYTQHGMTLRDWFAGQALNGFAQSAFAVGDWSEELLASLAFKLADAMLAERAKGGEA